MKITFNHPIAKHITQVSQEVSHNGISYDVVDEYYDGYEVEHHRLYLWKKCNRFI